MLPQVSVFSSDISNMLLLMVKLHMHACGGLQTGEVMTARASAGRGVGHDVLELLEVVGITILGDAYDHYFISFLKIYPQT